MKFLKRLILVVLEFNLLIDVSVSLKAAGIVGGDPATEHQLTYQVSVYIDFTIGCGGGIMSDDTIMTAAHCFFEKATEQFTTGPIVVVTSALDLDNVHPPSIIAYVIKIYVHRAYMPVKPQLAVPFRVIGDIAILRLENGLGLGSNPSISALNLPNEQLSYDTETFIIAGYGCDKSDYKYNTTINEYQYVKTGGGILRFAMADALDNERCNDYGHSPVYACHICARIRQRNPNKPEGTCTGDSGSPLVLANNIVVGILASGPGSCDERMWPSVYTRVSSYLSFIYYAMRDMKTNDMRIFTRTMNEASSSASVSNFIYVES